MGAKDVITNGPLLRPSDPVAPGRVAVVTGAASGIGFGPERFAAEGMYLRRVRRDTRPVRGVQARRDGADRDALLQPDIPGDRARRGVGALPGAVRTNF